MFEKLIIGKFWHAGDCRSCEATNHKSRHCPVDHRFTRLGSTLVVLAQPSMTADPAEGAFHHPPTREEFEPCDVIGSLDDLQDPAANGFHPPHQLARIAAI